MFPPTTQILIVDDASGMRQLLKGILTELGFSDLNGVENGRAAYDLICEKLKDGKKFDLILCDWNMPEMSGLELLQLVRSNPEVQDTPFLMITVQSEYAQLKAALDLKVDGYVLKPFLPETIRERLEKVWTKINTPLPPE